MHTITKFWIFLVFSLVFSITFSQGEYWLSDWSYRIPITITERSGNTLTDYQVLVTINTQNLISQGKMRNDCGDIRFTDSDGITLLNYWIESGCNTNNTRIWVKVPNIPANSNKIIYLYYGNPSATSMSNGTATFIYFDLGDIFSTWTKVEDVSGCVIQDTSIGNPAPSYRICSDLGNYLYKNVSNIERGSSNVWIHIQVDMRSTGLGEMGFFQNASGYGTMVRLDTRSDWYSGIAYINSFTNWLGPENGGLFLERTASEHSTNTWYRFNITINGTHIIKACVEQTNFCNVTAFRMNISNVFSYISLIGDQLGSSYYTWFDNIIIRKLTSPEPTISIGNEEFLQITIHSPQNTTYFSNVITINTTIISTFPNYYYSVKILLNNNEIYSANNLINENNIVFNYTLTEENIYNLTVIANITELNYVKTFSVIFTFKNFEKVIINLYSDYNYLPNQTLENFYYFFELEIINANPYANFDLIYFNYTNNYTIQKLAYNKFLLKFYTENIDSNQNIFVNRTALFTLSAYLANINKIFYYNFTYNFLVYNLNLYNCTNPNTLKILAFDEETLQGITLNYSYIRITYYSFDENYKETKTFENSLNICVYPGFANYYFATVENILLRKDNYAFAEYYSYEKIILSNSTREISLYLLSNQYATPIKFKLPKENYIIAVERRYDNNFVFLRSTKADFNRYALIYLRPYDVFYRIKVYDLDFNLCFISSDFRIANSEYTLDKCQVNITFEPVKSPFPEKNVIINCELFGNNLTCEFESIDKLDHNVTIEIYKMTKPFGRLLYNKTSVKAVSGKIDFYLEDGTYEIIVYANSALQHLLTKILQIGEGFVKNEALLYMFLLISISLAVAGAVSNPIITLIGQILLSIVMFTLNVSVFAISMVSSLVLLTAIAFYFLRR